MNPSVTVVIAVYNKSENLRYVFAALARQSFPHFDVIIADDGSGKEVADVVNGAKRKYSFPIRHLWHADKGWRKNTMLNYAVLESRTEYLIFIDGDCLPSRRFVEDHVAQREEGKVLLGRRVEHGKRWADELTLTKIERGDFEHYTVRDLIDALHGKSVRLEHGIRIPVAFLRRFIEKSDNMLGCNFSTYKRHLIDVNGFDEEYDGPGSGEDSDLYYRLNLIGIRGKSLRNLAIQYHLWHPLTRTPERTYFRFLETKKRGEAKCVHGLENRGGRHSFTEQ